MNEWRTIVCLIYLATKKNREEYLVFLLLDSKAEIGTPLTDDGEMHLEDSSYRSVHVSFSFDPCVSLVNIEIQVGWILMLLSLATRAIREIGCQ